MSTRRVYQSSDGRWIYWDGEAKHFHNTKGEAYLAMATRKQEYALSVRAAVTAFADAAATIAKLDDIYIDSGFDSEGEDPITEVDLVGLKVTVGNLASASVFANNLGLFLNAGDPLVFDYASAINKFRNTS